MLTGNSLPCSVFNLNYSLCDFTKGPRPLNPAAAKQYIAGDDPTSFEVSMVELIGFSMA